MFDWFFGKRAKRLEEETKKGFSEVKKDMNDVGRWVKHLDERDKQLFDVVFLLRRDLSTIKEEIEGLRETINLVNESMKSKQLFRKLAVLDKQTAVEGVQKAVQTPVQTANFYGILKELSSSERLVVMALLNNEMKLSYEDLALLLGKERATVRGQINAIKQKSEGLIEEIIEKNGKKRVFIPVEIREKFAKYAKVRVKKNRKEEKNEKSEVKLDESEEIKDLSLSKSEN